MSIFTDDWRTCQIQAVINAASDLSKTDTADNRKALNAAWEVANSFGISDRELQSVISAQCLADTSDDAIVSNRKMALAMKASHASECSCGMCGTADYLSTLFDADGIDPRVSPF